MNQNITHCTVPSLIITEEMTKSSLLYLKTRSLIKYMLHLLWSSLADGNKKSSSYQMIKKIVTVKSNRQRTAQDSLKGMSLVGKNFIHRVF